MAVDWSMMIWKQLRKKIGTWIRNFSIFYIHDIKFNSFHFIHNFFTVFYFSSLNTSHRMAKDDHSLQDDHLRHNTDVCFVMQFVASFYNDINEFQRNFSKRRRLFAFFFSYFFLIHYIYLICVVFFSSLACTSEWRCAFYYCWCWCCCCCIDSISLSWTLWLNYMDIN